MPDKPNVIRRDTSATGRGTSNEAQPVVQQPRNTKPIPASKPARIKQPFGGK